MNTSKRFSLLASAVLLGACSHAGTHEAQALSIAFELLANGQPARCSAPLGPLGREQIPAQLHDARFYVQDVALIAKDGHHVPLQLTTNDWQNANVALLDFEDGSGHCVGGTAATNHEVRGSIPPGDYVGLALTLGVPPALNHTSTELEPPPLDIAAMGWSWQAGRKFAKLEVDPQGGVAKVDGSRSATWYVHLGSTGCTGNPVTGETVSCLRSNRLPLQFERFDPKREAVVLDLSVLLGGSDIGRDQGMAVGCMSGPDDPECGPLFERLGLNLQSGEPLRPGYSPSVSRGARP